MSARPLATSPEPNRSTTAPPSGRSGTGGRVLTTLAIARGSALVAFVPSERSSSATSIQLWQTNRSTSRIARDEPRHHRLGGEARAGALVKVQAPPPLRLGRSIRH